MTLRTKDILAGPDCPLRRAVAASMHSASPAAPVKRRAARGEGKASDAKREFCARQRSSGSGRSPVEVVVPIRVHNPLNGGGGSRHWRVEQSRRRAVRMATAVLLHWLVPPSLPVVVTLTRVGRGVMDSDAVPASLKGVRDEVAAFLGADDADPLITWVYKQDKAKFYEVRISIVPRDAAEGTEKP